MHQLSQRLLLGAALTTAALAQMSGPAVGPPATPPGNFTMGAGGGTCNVLYVHADYDDCALQLQTDLFGTGNFGSVDLFDAKAANPTLVQLQAYDAVLTNSNFSYFDHAALGDVLADYVDAGGGVVVAIFGDSSVGLGIGGRWVAEDYNALEHIGHQGFDGSHFLGTVHDPGSPLMAGVGSFDGGTGSFRPNHSSITPGSSIVAEWSTGDPLIVQHSTPGRVDLGMWPNGYTACGSANGWNAATDGLVILSNALVYACSGGSPGGPIGTIYCSPANLNSSGSSAVISGFGSETAASNNVRLDAAQMAANQFGYFINSMTQGFVMPPGSQGNLCLGGAIGRHTANVMSTGATGEFSLQLNLNAVPTPGGDVAINAGETWYWQAWFRDVNPGNTSNFTDGICITFN